MRDAPDAAAVAGVEIESLKVRIFVFSAALGAFAGSLFAHYVSFISVDSFSIDRAISFLLIAVLGGVRSIAGTIAGALFVTAAPNYLSRFGDIHPILFAAILIVAVIFLPGGFGGMIAAAWRASPSLCVSRRRGRAMTALLRSSKYLTSLWRPGSAQGRLLRCHARIDHRIDRSQRRGQEHAVQHHLGILEADGGRYRLLG